MALVVLSKVEQRLDAVRAVLGGAKVSEVAGSVGVSRQRLHTWLTRVPARGGGRAGGPVASARVVPHETLEPVRVKVAELGLQHSRWGAKRIRMELLKTLVDGETIPATATINRILISSGWCSRGSGNGQEIPTNAGTAEADAAVAARHRRRGMAG